MGHRRLTMSNHVVGVRVGSADLALLRSICRARGEHVSDFIRRSIRRELADLSYVSDDEKKALGKSGSIVTTRSNRLQESVKNRKMGLTTSATYS